MSCIGVCVCVCDICFRKCWIKISSGSFWVNGLSAGKRITEKRGEENYNNNNLENQANIYDKLDLSQKINSELNLEFENYF